MRHGSDQLLGADAGSQGRLLDEGEAPYEPGGGGGAQLWAPGRGGVAPLGARRGQGLDHGGQGRVVGGPDGAVDHAALVGAGHLGQPGQPVVGIGRQAERHGAATNSAKRARPTSSSTTCRVADSSPSLWPTTSPSRWMAASTSPRAQGTTSCTTRSDPRKRSPSTRSSAMTRPSQRREAIRRIGSRGGRGDVAPSLSLGRLILRASGEAEFQNRVIPASWYRNPGSEMECA